ncbi:MAG: DUF4143 domain-containing protein [Actinobacteria bacterium]|nr:DUF4143 domain-containing protein [Actinomycetota bacterium]
MAFARWWDGYMTTYLERDLRQLSQVESLPDFRRVVEALALRTGQVLNQTELARDTQVSQPTVHCYLNLLETGCLLVRVQAFALSRTKRLVKSPKVFWFDPGLPAYLSGFYSSVDLRSSREAGGVVRVHGIFAPAVARATAGPARTDLLLAHNDRERD